MPDTELHYRLCAQTMLSLHSIEGKLIINLISNKINQWNGSEANLRFHTQLEGRNIFRKPIKL